MGACEGNFTLHNIDKISKGYLIECDKGWVEALKYTFEPYKDKVEICDKYVLSQNVNISITIDSLTNCKADYIKMDTEEEVEVLKEWKYMFESSNGIRYVICVYHRV